MILPGATLGVLGGGQLGRMFTVAARTLGYDVWVVDPDPESPAGAIASRHLCADYLSRSALEELAQQCAAVTTEFENVPAGSLEYLATRCVVRPAAAAVAIAQDRIREKTFLQAAGLPTAAFATIRSAAELESALAAVGLPAVLKVARLGYDGKGQMRLRSVDEARRAWERLGNEPCILESLVALETEISIVLARNAQGEIATYPIAENSHRHGILELTRVPACIDATIAREAERMAKAIATQLNYVGVMAVEFFVSSGRVLVNEIAPRPHNSGHYTLDACVTSQFEQQVRALCGLPLGDVRLLTPVTMLNLLGELWAQGTPAWDRVLAHPGAKLHLYGKRAARPGRKMGHINCLHADADSAWVTAQALKKLLSDASQSPPAAGA